MSKKRILYVLENPLKCLEITANMLFESKKHRNIIILPEFIEPWRFESLLLKNRQYMAGLEIYGISNLPELLLKKAGFVKEITDKKRIDQVLLSEFFARKTTRGTARLMINAISELKQAFFELDYLKDVFADSGDEAQKQLLSSFDEYNRLLENNNCYDEGDLQRLLFEYLSDPLYTRRIFSEGTDVFFTGFMEFTSRELINIELLSKCSDNCSVITGDIFSAGTEYSRILSESFLSMNFEVRKITDAASDTAKVVYGFDSHNDEVSGIGNTNGGRDISIYTPARFELYHSLFRYYLEDVQVQSVPRLDRSQVLSFVVAILRCRAESFRHGDFLKLLYWRSLWDCHDDILKLVSFLNDKGLFPSGIDYWRKLKQMNRHEAALDNIISFMEYIYDLFPESAKPVVYAKGIASVFERVNNVGKVSSTEKNEISAVSNLAFRVAEALQYVQPHISADLFAGKLYIHAEENYMINSVPCILPCTISPVRLLTSNINDQVWFTGMSEEAVLSMLSKDVVFSEQLFIYLRNHGLVKPTRRESYLNQCEFLKSSLRYAHVSYVKSEGKVSKLIPDERECGYKTEKTSFVLGAYSLLYPDPVSIENNKAEKVTVSGIERYIECPYKYFAFNMLDMKADAADDLSATAFSEGSILHECIQLTIKDVVAGMKIDIRGKMNGIIQKYEDEFKLNGSPLNKSMGDRLAGIISRFMETEKAFFDSCGNLEILCNERELECYLHTDGKGGIYVDRDKNGILLGLRIDRMDLDKKTNSIFVIDYKKSKTPSRAEFITGEKIQIPLYILAASASYPEYDCAGGYYINLTDNKRGLRILKASADVLCTGSARSSSCIETDDGNFNDMLKNQLSVKAYNAVTGMLANRFTPMPLKQELCNKCEFRGGCRVLY
ncbi:MAG: PD-(D/E)XK nuclease family protein [Oligoflexia bacterium]|nr:PD-(D/E)XK nuclease family protein [Oligoflexia bacterium]